METQSEDIEVRLGRIDLTDPYSQLLVSEQVLEGSKQSSIQPQRGPFPTMETHLLPSKVQGGNPQSDKLIDESKLRHLVRWFQKEYEKADALIAVEQDEWTQELMSIRGDVAGTAQSFDGLQAPSNKEQRK
jgi:hypothetical protein